MGVNNVLLNANGEEEKRETWKGPRNILLQSGMRGDAH